MSKTTVEISQKTVHGSKTGEKREKKIPILIQGVRKIPILAQNRNVLPPPFSNGIALKI